MSIFDDAPNLSRRDIPVLSSAMRDRLNTAMGKIRSASPLAAGGANDGASGYHGSTVIPRAGMDYIPQAVAWGKINDAGGHTDARYTVQFVGGYDIASGSPSEDGNIAIFNLTSGTTSFVVTNRNEVHDGGADPSLQTHSLPDGMEVICFLEVLYANSSSVPNVCTWNMYVTPSLSVENFCLDSTSAPNCSDNIPSFSNLIPNVTTIAFSKRHFELAQQVMGDHPCNPSTLLVYWNGVSVQHWAYGSTVQNACQVEVFKFQDNATTPAPDVSDVTAPSSTAKKYQVYFDVTGGNPTNSTDTSGAANIVDPCTECSPETFNSNTAVIKGFVYADSLSLTVEDCASGSYSNQNTLVFASGLNVANSGATSTITLDLSIDPTSAAYLQINAAGSGCGKVLKLCTQTVTVMTGCNSDGSPTYLDIVVLTTC